MDIRENLAILYSNISIPLEEFQKLPAFDDLEQIPNVIKEIQSYHLPEVTRLICASPELIKCGWASPYLPFQDFCLFPEKIDVFKELNTLNADGLVSKFLSFGYEPVILRFSSFFKEEENKLKELKSRKTYLKKIINKRNAEADKAKSESVKTKDVKDKNDKSSELSISEMENELQKVEKDIDELNRATKLFKKHRNQVEKWLEKCKSEEVNKNREDAYSIVEKHEYISRDDLLNDFIRSGEVSESFRNSLKDEAYIRKILYTIGQSEYSGLAYPILAALYEKEAIDLKENYTLFKPFIDTHKEWLLDYLISESSPNSLTNNKNEIFLEAAVRIEAEQDSPDESFPELWNLFSDPSSWIWIYDKLTQIVPGEENYHFIKFGFNLNGAAAEAFSHTLFPKISLTDFYRDLLSREECITCGSHKELNAYRDVTACLIELQEQALKQTERKARILERKLNSKEQELFSSTYTSIEQLEELAVNLYCSNGTIRCSLVAGQLMNMISSLRSGLSSMGLEPIIDSDDWLYQKELPYDAEKHRFTVPMDNPPESVCPRTMGFSYRDEDGNEQCHTAKVYIKAKNNTDIPNPEKRATRHKIDKKVEVKTVPRRKNKHRKGTSKR